MTAPRCKICALPDEVVAKVDSVEGHRVMAVQKYGHLDPAITDYSMKIHRRHQKMEQEATELAGAPAHRALAPKLEPLSGGSLEMGLNGGTLSTGTLSEPVTDWDQVLEIWGLDPRKFEVVEPVTFRAWDGWAKVRNIESYDEDGNPDLVTEETVIKRLYSYKASVQKKSASSMDLDAFLEKWTNKLMESRGEWRLAPASGDGVTYVMKVADPQLGKTGTDEALGNWKRGVEEHCLRIVRYRQSGVNVTNVAVAFMGDEHEGVANNYGNQAHVVELNFSEQIELDFDMRVWTLDTVLSLDPDITVDVVSVISNHGEWTRNGGKDVVTTKSDNSSTSVGRTVKKLFDRGTNADRITWHIADDNPDVLVTLSGVQCSFSHGHIAKGRGASTEQRAKSAIEKQILGRTEELMGVSIYFTAHYHHFYMLEFEGRTLFGCPALEAEKSSEYMLSQYGVWSRPGMLGMLVGASLNSRGWMDPACL